MRVENHMIVTGKIAAILAAICECCLGANRVCALRQLRKS